MSGTAVGFYIGSSASYVVVARQGGVEVLFNEFEERNTPTCVSYKGKMRYIGFAAKQQPIKDVRNRICAFSRFMGRTFNDGMNEIKARKYIGYNIVAHSDNQLSNQDVRRVAFSVECCGDEIKLCVEQVYAMQLIKLKEIAEIQLGKEVVDVVINVPTNATESHRRAIFDAAKIVNVKCVLIINDTTATALAYAFYHPVPSELCHKERTVVFVDMGYSHLQSSIVSFRDGEICVIASSCGDIGGYDFDRAIYDRIKNEFERQHNEEVEDNTKTAVRLMEECEKLKKSMNASIASIPLNIDCFMGGVDLSTTMQRSEFEALCKDILSRVRMTLERLVVDGRVRLEDIDDVEIVGGSTRLSAVKQIIKEVFDKEPRVSLNAEEAVAKGCAVQAAIISRVEQFKEIKIVDLCPHKITLRRDDENDIINMGIPTFDNETIPQDLPMQTMILEQLSMHIGSFKEEEKRISEQIKSDQERVFAKNLLLEFVNKMRDEHCATDADYGRRCALLDEAEIYVNQNNENITTENYKTYLEDLRSKFEPNNMTTYRGDNRNIQDQWVEDGMESEDIPKRTRNDNVNQSWRYLNIQRVIGLSWKVKALIVTVCVIGMAIYYVLLGN